MPKTKIQATSVLNVIKSHLREPLSPFLRKSSYARHLLRQPPLERDSTPLEGFPAAAAPIYFSLIKRVFRCPYK